MTASGGVELDQLAALRRLLVMSSRLTRQVEQARIVRMVAKAAESLVPCRTEGILLDRVWQEIGRGRYAIAPSATVSAAACADGGRVAPPGAARSWAYPIPVPPGQAGCLVVSADQEPKESDHFVLRFLAQQAGVALANARLHARERAQSAGLLAANLALRRSMEIHDRLTQVALQGEGQEGIARAVYELTEHGAGIRDSFGNLVTWAGPGRPDPAVKGTAGDQARLLDRIAEAQGPVRDGDYLVSVARLAGAPVGLLMLADPGRTAGEAERVTVEHATTILTMEVARLQSLGESQARARANLVLELVAGAAGPGVASLAQSLGYDLGRPHRVIALECSPSASGQIDAFFHGVRRAAAALTVGSLLAARLSDVVLLADAEASWDQFHAAVVTELHGTRCSIGVGGRCLEIADFPRSYRESQLALRIQKAIGRTEQVTVFDQLGVYQVLATETDTSAMASFVSDWLGALTDYDTENGAQLVRTLSEYLDHGGSYSASALALSVHRSTLKYRLRRIREVSGHDLSNPDAQFNLQLATRAWRTLQALRQG
jgi:sugar diacid utilization regulator